MRAKKERERDGQSERKEETDNTSAPVIGHTGKHKSPLEQKATLFPTFRQTTA